MLNRHLERLAGFEFGIGAAHLPRALAPATGGPLGLEGGVASGDARAFQGCAARGCSFRGLRPPSATFPTALNRQAWGLKSTENGPRARQSTVGPAEQGWWSQEATC